MLSPGFCNSSYLPTQRGFDSFFGQWSHVVDYYTRCLQHYPFSFTMPYYTRMAPVKDDGGRAGGESCVGTGLM